MADADCRTKASDVVGRKMGGSEDGGEVPLKPCTVRGINKISERQRNRLILAILE